MSTDYTLPKAVDFTNLSAKAQKAVTYAGRILQPKWDGCALIVQYDGPTGDARAISASGKAVQSCDHLAQEIIAAATKYRPGASFHACAEVWNPDMSFQEISGAFRRHAYQPHLVARWFDFAYADEQSLPYVGRTSWMDGIGTLHCAGHMQTHSEEHAWETARHWKSIGGFDGAILRDPYAPFVLGRSKGEIIKLKPLVSHDVLCIRVDAAVGEKTGRPTVALVCRWKDGTEQKVSTGLNHEQQANPTQFLGQIIEVEAMGYTEDGFLREPRFKGVRHDKTQADF
jgi:DNA ligase-1